jgi:hypothetical protein
MNVLPVIRDPRLEQAFRFHSQAADLDELGDRAGAIERRCRAVAALGYETAPEAPTFDGCLVDNGWSGWIDWRGIRQALGLVAGLWALIWVAWPR